jgi:hypothetical protein
MINWRCFHAFYSIRQHGKAMLSDNGIFSVGLFDNVSVKISTEIHFSADISATLAISRFPLNYSYTLITL